jgi:hypothetical protein
MKNENDSFFSIFKENELNVSRIYAFYAEKIQEKSDFWKNLSNEEFSHAAEMDNNLRETNIIVENKFARKIAAHITNFILEETRKARDGKVTHEQALAIALRIEQSMLEKKCFDIFTPTEENVREFFIKLNKDAEKHVMILLKEAKKNNSAINNQINDC